MKEANMTVEQLQAKRYKGRLNYYENKLGMSHEAAVERANKKGVDKPVNNGSTTPAVSAWRQRQLERKAREDATKAHPLGLEKCPFCGAEYFRKVGDKTEPVKMDHCDPCAARYYFYRGPNQ